MADAVGPNQTRVLCDVWCLILQHFRGDGGRCLPCFGKQTPPLAEGDYAQGNVNVLYCK